MDDSRFDRLTKRLAERRSRREVVRALVASALGGAVTVAGVESGLAKPPGPKPIVCPKGKPDLCYGTTCVSLAKDPANCGGCGNVCFAPVNGYATCKNGGCGTACNAGYTACGDSCLDTSSDPANCGSCGNTCASGETCENGSCTPQCGSGEILCSGVCVDSDADPNNCGACGTVCSFPNAAASCKAGVCVMETCNPGYADCDGVSANGCETDIQNDPNHCGDCGTPCEANTNCVNGVCGGCVGCGPGQQCVNGTCTCRSGSTLCPDGCFDLTSDSGNCGECGIDCHGFACDNGTCSADTCANPTETTNCGDGCYNLNKSQNNCGECGKVCPSGTSCVGGDCTCPEQNNLICNGVCVAFLKDRRNCGSCGNACQLGDTCLNGTCGTDPLCTDGLKNGNQTDIDCGGGRCTPCATGKACLVNSDCVSNNCLISICQ